MKEYQAVKRRRTEQERLRRHLYGDKGAKFQAKEFCIGYDGICNTITLAMSKDDLICEIVYINKHI